MINFALEQFKSVEESWKSLLLFLEYGVGDISEDNIANTKDDRPGKFTKAA